MTFDEVYSKLPKLRCKKACTDSCGPILMDDKEKERIKKALGEDPFFTNEEILCSAFSDELEMLQCRCLKNGECSIYEIRPLICRLFGMVKRMECPHGCKPERFLTTSESYQLLMEIKEAKESS